MKSLCIAAAMLCLASPAQALEAKQCLPMAEMNAALKADGQRTIIIGNRLSLSDPTGKATDWITTRYANAVTSNVDGSLGYQLEGDLPRTQASTLMCVRARLTNIRMFDARKEGPPPRDVLLGGIFTASVYELAAKGTRAMLIGETMYLEAPGKYRRGAPLVMFHNPKGGGGSLTTMNDKGSQLLAVLDNLEYTPEGLRRLAP